MILIDANLLLYAHDRRSERHEAARSWLERALAGPEAALIPWPVILAFLRISTNSRVWPNPFTLSEATAAVGAMLDLPQVSVAHPGPRHWAILNELLIAGQCRGNLITDAHLAAIAVENGARLYTTDRDFERFPNLDVSYPLA